MDMEQLVEAVTRAIMQRLDSDGPRIVRFGDVPDGLFCDGAQVKPGETGADIEGCDYIVLTAERFYALHGGGAEKSADAPLCAEPGGQNIDLTAKRLIHERDLRDHNAKSGDVVRVAKNAIVTALAHDYAKGIGAKIVRG